MESSDILAIQSVVTQILHAIDGRRWTELTSLFTADVKTDYTSLFGGDVQSQTCEQLIDGWKQLLSPLDATQHLLGPITVSGNNPYAVAQCHVRGYHVTSKKITGGNEWMVAGHYTFRLQGVSNVWCVSSLKLQLFYQTGNRDLLRLVSAAAE